MIYRFEASLYRFSEMSKQKFATKFKFIRIHIITFFKKVFCLRNHNNKERVKCREDLDAHLIRSGLGCDNQYYSYAKMYFYFALYCLCLFFYYTYLLFISSGEGHRRALPALAVQFRAFDDPVA